MPNSKTNNYMIQFLVTIGDFLWLNLLFVAVYSVFKDRLAEEVTEDLRLIVLLINICYALTLFFQKENHRRRIQYVDKLLQQAFTSVLMHLIVFGACLIFLRVEDVSRLFLITFYISFFVVLSLWWIAVWKLLKIYRMKGYNYRRIVIVGAGKTGLALLKELKKDESFGYKFMGFFDDNPELRDTLLDKFAGTTDEVENYVLENNIDEIFCALPGSQDDKILRLLNFSENHMVRFNIVPEINRYVFRRLNMEILGHTLVLTLRKEPLNNLFHRFIKRSFDISFSSVFILLFPFWYIPIALAVKASSPGPVLFKQKRTGRKGKEFYCYKFRTMKVNADCDSVQATKHDPRKTKVGEFLRKTNLDEIPQFINVFKGEMSVVGPRPHMLKHTQDYSKLVDKYMVRHLIKPGLTGWAQVNGYRGETKEIWQMEKRVEHDVWYLENWSLWLDIKIVIMTSLKALKGDKQAF